MNAELVVKAIMKKSRRPMQIVILIAVLIIGGYAIGSTLFENDKTKVKIGAPPPDFHLADLSGSPVQLADYSGKALVINFWGTFCEPCVTEMPEFERQYEKWKDKGLVIAAINLSEDTLTVNNFVKRFNLSYPILRDVNRKTERLYGLRSYPTTFFVKPDGNIMDIIVGGMTEAAIEQRVTLLLEQ